MRQPILLLAATSAIVSGASAAVVTGLYTTNTAGTVHDLTAAGNAAWAYGSSQGSTTTSTGTVMPFLNTMSGGTVTIAASAIGAANVQGGDANDGGKFSFSNGVSPASGTAIDPASIRFGNLNSNVLATGEGLSVTLTGLTPTNTYTVSLYTFIFGGFSTQLAGSVNGTVPGTLSTIAGQTAGEGASAFGVYTLTITPDAGTTSATFDWTVTADIPSGSNSQWASMKLEAVSVSAVAIPEPTTVGLAGGAFAFAFVALRRRLGRAD